jgi:hypothetical protein
MISAFVRDEEIEELRAANERAEDCMAWPTTLTLWSIIQ